MSKYLFLYFRINNTFFVRLFRFTILISGFIAVFFTSTNTEVFKTVLVLYSYFILHELFIHFYVDRAFPYVRVTENPQQVLDAVLFKTRMRYIAGKDGRQVIQKIIQDKDVTFIMQKIGEFKMPDLNIPKDEILKKAFELALELKGSYVTSADMFTAYILLTELQTKILQEKELTEKDLLEILVWSRQEFHLEQSKKHVLHFTGYGVFDFFIYGWDTYIKDFAYDITYSVLGKKAYPIVGREKEFNEMTDILSKSTVNNVLLVGETGVGKTSLVYRLALESYRDPRFMLGHRKVYEVMVDRLLSGVNTSSDLETRLGMLFAEVNHSGNIILFFQNIENIFGGGGFGFDMSGVLFEYLKNGSIQIIGSTTPGSYKEVVEKKQSIMHLFERVSVQEPEREQVFEMIAAHVPVIEHEYGVSISYKAIHDATELASSYFPDQVLPGKAINLLTDVAARVRHGGGKTVDKDDVVAVVQEKTNIVLEKPSDEEKDTLLHLEEQMHKRVIGQNDAIIAVAKAIRRLRSGFTHQKRPISVFLFLGPTGVGKTETAKTLADIYYGDEAHMIRLDMSEYQTQNEVERLLGGLPGGGEISSSLSDQVREHPFSLILLDEFEKAHPHILDIFLQVFEDGRLTDNQGKTVSFTNTIIIATSNAGSETIREMVGSGEDIGGEKNKIIDGLLQSGIFKPELINRFDDVIIFQPLSIEDARQIAKLLIKTSLHVLENDQMYLTFDDKVIDKVVAESFDVEAGARNMRRYIGAEIEDFISQLILKDQLPAGTHAMLSVDSNNKYILENDKEVVAEA